MPHAIVATTASKASLTGGTFADSLTANSGDSLNVVNFNNGGARVLEAWGIDSASVAELSWVYTRPEATHDQSRGVRFSIASAFPGGAGNVAAHMLLGGYGAMPVYPGDTATLNVSGTAADAVVVTYVIEYDDMPGAAATFATWEAVVGLRKSTVGIRCSAVASGTKGAYGSTRAINADDNRFHAGSYYAILGATVQTAVTTIVLTAPEWGGQKIALPAGAPQVDNSAYFVDQTRKWQKPLIPVFNGLNASNVLVQVADQAASTSPQIDFLMYELSGPVGV